MISIAELSHTYRSPLPGRRAVQSLQGISLEIASGSCVGVIGVNGAGKTTLLRILLGYLQPSAGRVSIAGRAPRAYAERHGIGYVPERVSVPRRWTVEGALQAYSLLGNVGDDGRERVEEALSRLGLETVRHRRVGSLSKGNLQRLAIAQALLCDRRLLVLDEPTDGLDPVWIARLRGLVDGWRAEDEARVVLLATHNLPLVERIATRVLMLHGGRLAADLDLTHARPGEPLEDLFLRIVEREEQAA